MTGVFDINVDKLDLNKIRIGGQTTQASAAPFSREERTKSDLLQCVRQHTLTAFVRQCRLHNIDALHPCSLQYTILLVSKCTDRKQLCKTFSSFIANVHGHTEVDDAATTAIDDAESPPLQSTSDWVELFRYIEVAQLSESVRRALRENPRMAVFVRAMRHIFPEDTEVDMFVRPMLCTFLMHIPAANMLERVLLADGLRLRDMEVMCLRGVNSYVDQCQHMGNENNVEVISLLMQAVRVKAAFQTDVAGVVDAAAHTSEQHCGAAKRHFSLRRHLKDMQSADVLHRAMLFDEWAHELKFSVNVSPSTQRLLYFICAQTDRPDVAALTPFFDQQMLAKCSALNIARIDADAVSMVIKTLRVYQYNIEDLKEFRIQCLAGFNASVRATLTLPVVLQAYVACWQHASIREQCWRAVIPVYNYSIIVRCEEFRSTHAYDRMNVFQTLLHCHTGPRNAVTAAPDSA